MIAPLQEQNRPLSRRVARFARARRTVYESLLTRAARDKPAPIASWAAWCLVGWMALVLVMYLLSMWRSIAS